MQALDDGDIVRILGPQEAVTDQEVDDDEVAVELEFLGVAHEPGDLGQLQQRELVDLAVVADRLEVGRQLEIEAVLDVGPQPLMRLGAVGNCTYGNRVP